MRLAIDAMGGDHAPGAMVQGSIAYARNHPEHEVLLVGQQEAIAPALREHGGTELDNIRIEHAPEIIGMADKIQALKDKPDDSMNLCARLVKQGEADAMVLCGNTGCSVAAAQLHLRRIPSVKRAGILTPLPSDAGQTWVIDCGANAVNKAEHLLQFAEMGSAFLSCYSGIPSPRIGVLNIGSEDDKGDELTNGTLAQLRETKLNVIGNVEGNGIYSSEVDLVVCDGFTGNVVLKTSEGVASFITRTLKAEIKRGLLSRIGALLMLSAFERLRKRTHWSEVGGCLLLGVDGVTVIGHGRSDAVAVSNALGQAARCVDNELMSRLREALAAAGPQSADDR